MKKLLTLVILSTVTLWAQGQIRQQRVMHEVGTSALKTLALADFNRYLLHETFLRSQFNSFMATKVAFGYANRRRDTIFQNVVDYQSKGWYYKLGLNVMTYFQDSSKLIFGVNFVNSFYREKGTFVNAGPYWGDYREDFSSPIHAVRGLELELGIQGAMTKRLQLYFSGRMRYLERDQLFHFTGHISNFESDYIPGFGRPRSLVAGLFSLSVDVVYRIH